MNKRVIDLINDLIAEKSQTLFSLAEKHDCSVRTIRNDIKAINSFLAENGFREIEIRHSGVLHVDDDFPSCRQFLKVDDFYLYKLSREERISICMIILAMGTDYITLSELAAMLSVSRTTIIKDLPNIKDNITSLSLVLRSNPNRGLRIESDETLIRDALLKILVLNGNSETSAVHSFFDEQIAAKNQYDKIIQRIITEIEQEYQIEFTNESFQLLHEYLTIMVFRNSSSIFVEDTLPVNDENYRYAQDLLKYISQYCSITSTKGEVDYLAAKIRDTFHYVTKFSYDKETVALQICARDLIESVSSEISINLTHDYQLYENLSNHLNSIYHNSLVETSDNPVLADIRKTQTTVIKAVNKNIEVVESFFGRSLTDDEIIYIVIHFCTAIERRKTIRQAYDVILVCNAGIGTSQLIKAKLTKLFNFKIVDIIPSHQVMSLSPDSADLLISTVPVINAPIETVQISAVLEDDDYLQICNKLSQISLNHSASMPYETPEFNAAGVMDAIRPILYSSVPEHADMLFKELRKATFHYFNQSDNTQTDVFTPYLHHLLTPEFIALDIACADWKEAIRKSAQLLLQRGYIENSYISSMIRIVEQDGPYFCMCPGVALPHAGLKDGSYRTGMGLIRLKHPVNFGNPDLDPIRYVITLSAIDQKTHLKALFHLLSIFHISDFINEMDNASSPMQASAIIEKYEYSLDDY